MNKFYDFELLKTFDLFSTGYSYANLKIFNNLRTYSQAVYKLLAG